MAAVTPSPVRVPISCGPLSATLDGTDLVDVRWGGTDVAQRIYVAVRDEVWNTVPARITHLDVTSDRDVVRIEFDAEHRLEPLDYGWRGVVAITAAGTISFEMRGQARSTFQYCKIGFNVHHGMRSHLGREFRCRTVDGVYRGVFGAQIEPQLVRDGTLTAMTPPYDRLDVDIEGGHAIWEFSGDLFEMQDHRNWVDANWKSYGTPLAAGFPHTIDADTSLSQRVELTIEAEPTPVAAGAVAITIAPGTADATDTADAVPRTLPLLGHTLTDEPSPAQLATLADLRPDHIRIDLRPTRDEHETLVRGDRIARRLGAALEVAVHVRAERAQDDADAAARLLATATSPIARVLVLAGAEGFSALRGACPPASATAVRRALDEHGVDVGAVVAGTPQYFADINRDRPVYPDGTAGAEAIDGIVFAVNPQVHLCDDRSMMLNAEAITAVTTFARRLYPGRHVVLSPIDLLGINGPYPAGPQRTDGRPANVDERLWTDFAAAWTVAALAAMSPGCVESVTLFELVGARGLMDQDVFPVADMLARLRDLRRHPMLEVSVDDPERVAVLGFSTPAGRVLVLANTSPADVEVVLPWGADLVLSAYEVSVVEER